MKPTKTLHESQVEDYLVRRALALGGEVRKVQWVGRSKAPDRILMLPVTTRWTGTPSTTTWVEVKEEGGLAKFPKNAHERAQEREHIRMRKCGQTVVVVDSLAGVDALLG